MGKPVAGFPLTTLALCLLSFFAGSLLTSVLQGLPEGGGRGVRLRPPPPPPGKAGRLE